MWCGPRVWGDRAERLQFQGCGAAWYGAREAEGRVRAIADLRRLLWRRGQGGGEIADLMGWCGAREGRFKGVVLSQRGRDTGPRTRPQGLTSHMRVVFNLLRMYPPKKGMGLDGTCFTEFNFTIVSETYFGHEPVWQIFLSRAQCLPACHTRTCVRPYAVCRTPYALWHCV